MLILPDSLRQAIRLCGMTATRQAQDVVEEAEDWAENARAGVEAGRAAMAHAFANGTSVVYNQRGAIVEKFADGTVRVLKPALANPE